MLVLSGRKNIVEKWVDQKDKTQYEWILRRFNLGLFRIYFILFVYLGEVVNVENLTEGRRGFEV